VAFASGGQGPIARPEDKRIQLFDVPEGGGKPTLRRAAPEEDKVGCLAFSPGDRTLATADHDGNPKLWQAEPLEKTDANRRTGRFNRCSPFFGGPCTAAVWPSMPT
jgi:WD40 repeat protein